MDSTGDLYTGSNSGSFGNAHTEQREEIVAKKREQKSKIAPAYELVADFIDKELANVRSIESFLVDGYVPDEHLNTELIARRRYVTYLKGLKTNLANLLKETV